MRLRHWDAYSCKNEEFASQVCMHTQTKSDPNVTFIVISGMFVHKPIIRGPSQTNSEAGVKIQLRKCLLCTAK